MASEFTSESLHVKLAPIIPGEIRYFDVTGSTNDDALRWLQAGAPDGSLVVADEQTSGRGRMQRTWVTRPGASLAFSLIFRPQIHDQIPFYAPLGALGVALALEKLYGVCPEIKWPNDVLIFRKKVCGILAEADWQGSQLAGLVLGIGINVASTAVRKEDNFIFPADSLQNSLGRPIDRLDVLVETIRSVFLWRQKIGNDVFLREWNRRLAFRGEKVQIHRPQQDVMNGTVLHIAPDGALWIRTDNGEDVPVSAGDVSLRQTQTSPTK